MAVSFDFQALLDAFDVIYDANAWRHIGWIPIPATTDAWFVTLVGASAVSALIGLSDPVRSILFKRFKRRQWEICVSSKLDTDADKDSWNIIEMRREDIVGSNGLKLDKNKLHNTVVVGIRDGWRVRTQMARLKVNPQHAKGKVSMHPLFVDKLELGTLAEADATQADACSAKLDFALRHPAWYLLVPFWKHPDPSIRLQWQLGFLFLALGIFAPKMLP